MCMNIQIVDDNQQFADAIRAQLASLNGLQCQVTRPRSTDNAFKFSGTLVGPTMSDTIVLINLNLSIGSRKRQHQQGAEVLTWLRVKGMKNHCILYSFQDPRAIGARARQNLVLFSRGTSLVRLPINLAECELTVLKNELAENENLKTYLQSSFNISEFRHRDANWWGVKALWDVYRVATGELEKEYPASVKNRLSDINNAVGSFLHGLEVSDVNAFIDQLRDERTLLLANLDSELSKTIESAEKLNRDQQDWQEYISELRRSRTDLQTAQNSVDGELYKSFSHDAQRLMADISTASEETERIGMELTTSLERVERLRSEIQSCENILASIDIEAREQLFGATCVHPSNPCNLLMIDDNAKNGWEEIFKLMLPAVSVKSVVPDKKYENRIDDLYFDVIKKQIETLEKQTLPLLILLDLRLFDEAERSIDIENVSGRVLLNLIRQDFKCIPVLITTASNKVWTFQKLVNQGADAYWTKEGLDELRDASDSVRNYCRLQFLVRRLTDGRYQLLQKLTEYAVKFEKTKASHWSAGPLFWPNGETSVPDTDAISQVLVDSAAVLKNYLHNFYLGFGGSVAISEAFIVSGLINKLCGIYENIHPGIDPGMTERELWDRGDHFANVLRVARNRCSHATYSSPCSWAMLSRSVERVIDYLDRNIAPIAVPAASVI